MHPSIARAIINSPRKRDAAVLREVFSLSAIFRRVFLLLTGQRAA